jgi:hypothetical protein
MKEYGKFGIPISTVVLDAAAKCVLLRFVAMQSPQKAAEGWKVKEGILTKNDLTFSWNGMVCCPVSERAMSVGWFVFDGMSVMRRKSRQKLGELGDGIAATCDNVLLTLTTMIDTHTMK